MVGPYEQATKMLMAANSTIKIDPSKFYDFLEILNKQELGELAQELYQKCSKYNDTNASHSEYLTVPYKSMYA